MVNLDANHLLFIEPRLPRASVPVRDELTDKLRLALSYARPGPAYRGFHICACGKTSANHNLILENGMQTNSLASHYLEEHRDEVPESELEKIRQL